MSVGYLKEIIIILLNHYNVRSFFKKEKVNVSSSFTSNLSCSRWWLTHLGLYGFSTNPSSPLPKITEKIQSWLTGEGGQPLVTQAS